MARQSEQCTQITLGPFTTCVLVEGKEVPLYGVEKQGDETTCWIVSESGKNFAIWWSNSHLPYTVRARMEIDGIRCASKLSMPQPGNALQMHTIAHAETSRTTLRPFTFADIERTDDDSYLDHEVSSDLGTICCKILETTVKGRKTPTYSTPYTQLDGKIHEKSKKAMEHRMKLGEEIPRKSKQSTLVVRDIRRLATFTFKYRPLAFLQANGIVPRGPSLAQQTVDILDLSADEPDSDNTRDIEGRKQPAPDRPPSQIIAGVTHAGASYERIQKLTAELEKAKREYDLAHNSGNVKREIKEEGSSTGLAVKKEAPVENVGIIDLTDTD